VPRQRHRVSSALFGPGERQEFWPRSGRDSNQAEAVLRGLDTEQRPRDGEPQDPAQAAGRLLPAGHQVLLSFQQGPLREHQWRLAETANLIGRTLNELAAFSP